MGWIEGQLQGPFTTRAAIVFALGEEFAGRVLATARYGTVIYAAVREAKGEGVFGLVLLAERNRGAICTKPISEDMGPAEDGCPARILDLLSEPTNDYAREWRRRCRERIARGRPRAGQEVVFARPLRFTDGSEHQVLTYLRGSRFRSASGQEYHVTSWRQLDYRLGGAA